MTSVHDRPKYAKVRQVLSNAWTTYKDCQGTGCRVPMAEPLRVKAEAVRKLTKSFWQQVDARYGL